MAHNKMVLFFSVLLSLFPCVFLTAADFYVEYLDGAADVKSEKGWKELFIGDSLSGDSVLRIEDASVVELSAAGKVITLSRPGIYRLEGILREMTERDESGLSTILSRKVGTVFSGSKAVVQSAAAGVRGEEAGDHGGMVWVESDVRGILEAGMDAAAEGEMEKALALFREAYDNALDPSEEGDTLFYIAGACDALGKTEEALDALGGAQISPESEVYTDSYLLKGKILLQTFAYEELVQSLSSFKPAYGSKEEGQTVYLMIGIAYLGLDDSDRARTYFNKAREAGPETDAGKVADRMLSAL